jgi:hypothetical protein
MRLVEMVLRGHHSLHHVLRDRVWSWWITRILHVGRVIRHAVSRQHVRPLWLVCLAVRIINVACLRRWSVRKGGRHEGVSSTSLGVGLRVARIVFIRRECRRI